MDVLSNSDVSQLVPPLFVWQIRVVNINHMTEITRITDITNITEIILLATDFTLST